MTHEPVEEQTEGLEVQTASCGHGPLWQRDYWAEISGSSFSPAALIQIVRADFPAFSPPELAAFSSERGAPLGLGDEMKIIVKGYGECTVRCVHLEERSFTLRTMEDHPEAGRISFGAYIEKGHLVFRITSRARSTDRLRHAGYQLVGQKMQTQTWLLFIKNVVEKSGGELIGRICIRTREVKATLADLGELDTPTFIAKERP